MLHKDEAHLLAVGCVPSSNTPSRRNDACIISLRVTLNVVVPEVAILILYVYLIVFVLSLFHKYGL